MFVSYTCYVNRQDKHFRTTRLRPPWFLFNLYPSDCRQKVKNSEPRCSRTKRLLHLGTMDGSAARSLRRSISKRQVFLRSKSPNPHARDRILCAAAVRCFRFQLNPLIISSHSELCQLLACSVLAVQTTPSIFILLHYLRAAPTA